MGLLREVVLGSKVIVELGKVRSDGWRKIGVMG